MSWTRASICGAPWRSRTIPATEAVSLCAHAGVARAAEAGFGKVMVADGKFHGELKDGQYLKRRIPDAIRANRAMEQR